MTSAEYTDGKVSGTIKGLAPRLMVSVVSVLILTAYVNFCFGYGKPITEYSERLDAQYGEQLRALAIETIAVDGGILRSSSARLAIHYTVDGAEVEVITYVDPLTDRGRAKIEVLQGRVTIRGRELNRVGDNFIAKKKEWQAVEHVLVIAIGAVERNEAARLEWESQSQN